MFTAAGFERTWEYIDLFKEGLICTVSLSLLTVIFGFVLALLLAIMRLSNVRPFRFLGLTKDGHLREQGVLMVLSRFNPQLHRHGLRGSLPCHPYASSAFHDLLCGVRRY